MYGEQLEFVGLFSNEFPVPTYDLGVWYADAIEARSPEKNPFSHAARAKSK